MTKEVKNYQVSFAPHSKIEYSFNVDAKDADEAQELASYDLKFDIGGDRFKDFECVKIKTFNEETKKWGEV